MKHTIQEPIEGIKCIYLTYPINTLRRFEFYKDDVLIKLIYAKTYMDALDGFMKWYDGREGYDAA